MTAHHDHDHAHDHGHEHSGLTGLVRSLFAPHSHDAAADSVDSALTSSRDGIRAVKLSLVALGLTATAQLVVVLLTGSVALLADTIHNFSDALTAVPLWIAFVLARRAPTRRYTYGYGRAEDLLHPAPVQHLVWVAAAGLVGFAGNELVAVYRIRVGRRIGSAALVADGVHARADGFTSLAVAAGALGVMAGFPLADPIVGLLITVAILAVLRGAARDVYRRLMDGVEPALVDEAEQTLVGVPGVLAVESVRLRWVGHRLRAEAGLVVRHDLSLWEGHGVAVEAEHQLLHRISQLDDVTVHVSPSGTPDRDPHEALAHHRS